MKLATLKSKNRDGELLVVSRDNKRAVKATDIAPSVREAIENWHETWPKLQALYDKLNNDHAEGSFEVNEADLHSAMPRAFQ